MPSAAALAAFVDLVESGQHVEAIERYYAEDASMQENLEPPRVGRALLMAHEAAALVRAVEVRSRHVGPIMADGDIVVINWIFEFVRKDGSVMALDEIAHQTWSGDKIVRERFYYDPKQMRG